MSICAREVRLTVPECCLGSEAWLGTGNPKHGAGSAGWCLIAADSAGRPVKQALEHTPMGCCRLQDACKSMVRVYYMSHLQHKGYLFQGLSESVSASSNASCTSALDIFSSVPRQDTQAQRGLASLLLSLLQSGLGIEGLAWSMTGIKTNFIFF